MIAMSNGNRTQNTATAILMLREQEQMILITPGNAWHQRIFPENRIGLIKKNWFILLDSSASIDPNLKKVPQTMSTEYFPSLRQ